MKIIKYLFTKDDSTKEYLKVIFKDIIFIDSKDKIQERECIVFVHIQSFKDNLDELLQNLKDYKVAILSDNPSFNEGYKLLKYKIKAYANTHMASMHYKQLEWMLKSNNNWFYPEFTTELLNNSLKTDNSSVLDKLTNKEKQIAKLIKDGLKNAQIAKKLKITERTVKQHLSNIYEKLDIHDRVSLILLLK